MCDKEATAGIHNDIYEKQLEGGLYEMLQRHYQYIYKKSFNWINLKKKKRDKKINTIYDNIGFCFISVYSIRFKYTCPSHLTEIFISAALDRLQSNSRF